MVTFYFFSTNKEVYTNDTSAILFVMNKMSGENVSCNYTRDSLVHDGAAELWGVWGCVDWDLPFASIM